MPQPPKSAAAASEHISKQQRTIRAQRMIAESKMPGELLAHINHKWKHSRTSYVPPTFHPTITSTVPDFKRLQHEFDVKLSTAKVRAARPTVIEAFNLRTEQLSTGHHCVPAKRSTRPPRSKSASQVRAEMNKHHPSVRANATSVLRAENIRNELDRLQAAGVDLMRYYERRDARRHELKQLLTMKYRLDTIDARRRQELSVQTKRRNQRNQATEYEQQLADIETKLAQQPTLIDRQKALIARHSAQRRFENALINAGVSVNDMDKYSRQMDERVAEQQMEMEADPSSSSSKSSVASIKSNPQLPSAHSSSQSSVSSKRSLASDKDARELEVSSTGPSSAKEELIKEASSSSMKSSTRSKQEMNVIEDDPDVLRKNYDTRKVFHIGSGREASEDPFFDFPT